MFLNQRPSINMIQFFLNSKSVSVDVDGDTPLLWVIRDVLRLTGTKYGCGIALCGACTVHLDGMPVRSCTLPVSAAAGKAVTTAEGLTETAIGRSVQRAWIEIDVAQCGYCQNGQMMAAAALLKENPAPDDEQVLAAMTNICRCGTYAKIKQAVLEASSIIRSGEAQ